MGSMTASTLASSFRNSSAASSASSEASSAPTPTGCYISMRKTWNCTKGGGEGWGGGRASWIQKHSQALSWLASQVLEIGFAPQPPSTRMSRRSRVAMYQTATLRMAAIIEVYSTASTETLFANLTVDTDCLQAHYAFTLRVATVFHPPATSVECYYGATSCCLVVAESRDLRGVVHKSRQ